MIFLKENVLNLHCQTYSIRDLFGGGTSPATLCFNNLYFFILFIYLFIYFVLFIYLFLFFFTYYFVLLFSSSRCPTWPVPKSRSVTYLVIT